MTASEFKRKLIAHDNRWRIEQGTKHEYAIHPEKPGIKIFIHRHKGDIPVGTLSNMLKAAGLK